MLVSKFYLFCLFEPICAISQMGCNISIIQKEWFSNIENSINQKKYEQYVLCMQYYTNKIFNNV